MSSSQCWYDLLNNIVLNGTVNEMKQLLETKRADLDRSDGSGRTLLDYCVMGTISTKEFTPELLESASTPIHLKKAALLLKYGANPNVTDRRGWSLAHQCARNGDLTLLQLCVRYGTDSTTPNDEGQLPIDFALMKSHSHIVSYLEIRSLSLKCHCRKAIRNAMGHRTYKQINELPLPSSLKLFVNYGNPFPGWTASIYVPRPWTEEEIVNKKVGRAELVEFLETNASEEFIEEKKIRTMAGSLTVTELAEMFESLYFWEDFKPVNFEEPLARKPRYSMKQVEMNGKEEQTNTKRWADFSSIFKLKQ